MINRRVIVNLVVFFGLSFALVVYGALTLFGNPLRSPRTVVAELPDAAGLRTGFSASHDGVVVGTVGAIDLLGDGVRVTVELDQGRTIPAGVEAHVLRASAVGEQRLDFRSTGGEPGPPLADGAVVPIAEDPLPPDIADVLATTQKFLDALPAEDLNTVVHELAVGIDGRAGDLRAMTRSLTAISDDVVELEPELRALLESGPEVLDDFSEMSPGAHRALRNTDLLTRFLADRDEKLVDLLRTGTEVATTFDRVLVDNRAGLTCLVDHVREINATLQGGTLADLDRALVLNGQFFGLIDKVGVRGDSADVGYAPAQSDVLWLRTRLLFPPPQDGPAAIRYVPPRPDRPVLVGDDCADVFDAPATAAGGAVADPRDGVVRSVRAAGVAQANAAPGTPADDSGAPGLATPASGRGTGDAGPRLPDILLGLAGLVAVIAVARRLHHWRAP